MKIKFTLLCFAFALCLSKPIILNAQVNEQDSLALVDLYNSTNGPGWVFNTNWLTAKPVSKWYGITISDTRVTEINLSNNKLKGHIPSSIENLAMLTTLYFQLNKLSGNIPPEMGNLKNLNLLLLNSNRLSGNIPAEMGNLINLEFTLSLSDNQLSGGIPASFGNLINLHNLYLNNNQLSGSIPPELGNLENLNYLQLSGNQLTGNIPYSFGRIKMLTNLFLNDNRLSGRIPASFGRLKLLYELDLSNNKLSGPVSPVIALTETLRYLYLENNRLSGDVSSIATLPLFDLDISNNRFTFEGMELVAEQSFYGLYYNNQARIPVHINGAALSVSAGGTLSNNTYRWFMHGETGYTEIAGDSVFHPAKTGTYYVNIANSVATKLLLKSDTITYTATAALTNSIASSTNNLQSSKANQFSVYPNPAKNVLHVQVNGNASVSLLSDAGKILFTQNINGNGSIDISGFAAGVYYLKNNNSGAVQKVVVIK